MAGQAALLGVTGRATGRTLADQPSMLVQERRLVMVRGGLELRPDRQRAWIWSERLDRGHLGRVHVALGTEVPGVTGGAGGGDRASRTRQLSMQPGGESEFPMGCRSRKVAYRCAGESNRLDQGQVTGRAGGVGRVEVRRANSVASEAVRDNSAPHLHRVRTGSNVAGATWEHGISSRGLDHSFRVLPVGEPQIAGPRLVRRSPLHGALDGVVVARLAIGWGRPQGEAWIACTSVAPGAAGKDRPVLPVVEPVLNHPAARVTHCGDRPGYQHAREDPRQVHRTPARGSGGRAGGSRTASVSLRSTRVTRAMRRVWFQSKAAASGRSRVSA